MHRMLIAVLAVLLFVVPCVASDRYETVAVPCVASDRYETVATGGKETYYPAVPGPVFDGGRDILYDNGPLESQPGLSILDTTLGMSVYGFGHQTSAGNWIADEFFIPVGETWEIDEITFFAYQTGSPTNPSTMTAVYLEIYNGSPDDPASIPIWGGAAVNVLTSSMWTGLYRVPDYDLVATNRPIMANTCYIGTTLTAGEYWLVWQSDGSGASGPWAPPITIPGQIGTGNALQNTGTWGPVLDVEQQGFPFIIEGVHPSPVAEETWSSVKAMFR
jgi:hypothetical protein